MKRGQLTIFIIVGLVVLIAIGTTLYLVSRTSEDIQPTARIVDATGVLDMFEDCLNLVGTEAVYAVAAHGGYLNPGGDEVYGEEGDGAAVHYVLGEDFVPHIVDGSENFLRSKGVISNMISNYIVVEIKQCLNFSVFEEQGFSVAQPEIDWQEIEFDFSRARVSYSSQPISIDIVQRADDVVIQATYPLRLQREDQTIDVSEFTTLIPLRLSLLYDIADRLSRAVSLTQDYQLQTNCAQYTAPDANVNIYTKFTPYVLDYGLQIVDAKPLEAGNVPLRFKFAMKNVKFSGECVG